MSIFLCYQLSDLYAKGDEQDSSVQPENLDGSIASNLGTHVIQHLLSFEENWQRCSNKSHKRKGKKNQLQCETTSPGTRAEANQAWSNCERTYNDQEPSCLTRSMLK